MEVLREGYAIPFRMPPPLSPTLIILDSYSPQSVKGRALEEEIQAVRRKGAVEPAPPTPGFYNRMFVVTKATGGWRPIIDISTLNLNVDRTPFRMETSQTVLRSARRNDWMVSIDLKDAYLQIPIHPASRRFLRFTAGGRTWQFRSAHSPTGFHSCDGSCVGVPTSAGSLDASVPRRLTDPSFVSGGSLLGKGSSSQPLSGAGNCGQPEEVDPYSISTDYVLGNQDQLADFQGFGDSLEDRKFLLNCRISVLIGAVCEVLEGLAGPPCLSVSSGSEWSASNESFTVGSKSRLGFSGRGGPGSLGFSFSGRSSVVVHQSRPTPPTTVGGRRWQTISPQAFGWRARPLFRSTIASCWQ